MVRRGWTSSVVTYFVGVIGVIAVGATECTGLASRGGPRQISRYCSEKGKEAAWYHCRDGDVAAVGIKKCCMPNFLSLKLSLSPQPNSNDSLKRCLKP